MVSSSVESRVMNLRITPGLRSGLRGISRDVVEVQLLANHLANVVGELHWPIQRGIVIIPISSGSCKIAMKRTVASTAKPMICPLSFTLHASSRYKPEVLGTSVLRSNGAS